MEQAKDRNCYAGKIVCITGSSRGIGRKLALRFAQEEADVVINYFHNGDKAREVAKEIEDLGQRKLPIRVIFLSARAKIQVTRSNRKLFRAIFFITRAIRTLFRANYLLPRAKTMRARANFPITRAV